MTDVISGEAPTISPVECEETLDAIDAKLSLSRAALHNAANNGIRFADREAESARAIAADHEASGLKSKLTLAGHAACINAGYCVA